MNQDRARRSIWKVMYCDYIKEYQVCYMCLFHIYLKHLNSQVWPTWFLINYIIEYKILTLLHQFHLSDIWLSPQFFHLYLLVRFSHYLVLLWPWKMIETKCIHGRCLLSCFSKYWFPDQVLALASKWGQWERELFGDPKLTQPWLIMVQVIVNHD